MTPNNIAHILLIPHDDTIGALLGDGPFGARPPTLLLCSGEGHQPGWHVTEHRTCAAYPRRRALVLAYDGKVVWQGCDYAYRAVPWVSKHWFHELCDAILCGAAYPEEWDWPGTFVLLDSGGREVTAAPPGVVINPKEAQ